MKLLFLRFKDLLYRIIPKLGIVLDSLYQGYPVGYLIAWKNPDVKLKPGEIAAVVNKNHQKIRIRINFQPLEERFEVLNSAIEKDKLLISDIAEDFKPELKGYQQIQNYCAQNKMEILDLIHKKIENLKRIASNQIGN